MTSFSPRPNRLTHALRFSLLCLLPGTALAQQSVDTTPKTLDSIQVTGTRIKKAELETQVPVQVLTREAIERTGYSSVADVVQHLTASGASLSTKLNSSGNFGFPPDGGGVGAGAATVDLRHLGPKRVLVLVDGIRWVNESSGSGVGSSVDLNTIPLAIVDRIEVLEDGASSIYGSDAIAGVVNIITRKGADGGHVEVQHGDYNLKGGDTSSIDLSFGGSSDRAQWIVGASWFKQKEIGSSEYKWATEPVPGTGLANGSSATPGGRTVFAPPDGNNTYGGLCPLGRDANDNPIPGSATCNITLPNGASFGGAAGFPGDFIPFGTANRYNFAPNNLLLTPNERKSVFGQVRFEFNANVSGWLRGLYSERESANQAAPEPIFLGTDAGVYNDWAETRLVISANNPYNPFGFDLTTMGANPNLFLLGRRPVEGGPRRYEQDVKTWYAAGGLDGVFEVNQRTWNWDINVMSSESKATQTNTGSYNIKHINQALGDPAACAAIAGCVPLNLFGGPGTITPEMLAWISPIVRDRSKNTLSLGSANITGELFDIWAGPLSFAAGAEWRRYKGEYHPDPITVAGEYNGVPSGVTIGSYSVKEAYVEFDVPLAREGFWGKSLDLSIAGRYSDYSTFGGTGTGKIGLRWQPADELLLRMSFAQGFRAPSIGELYGTLSRFDATIVDPCNNAASTTPKCAADGVPPGYEQANPQISVVTSGNRDLEPEESRSFMAGAVWSPSWAEDSSWASRLDLGVTFYRHTIDKAIQAPDAQAIMDRCIDTRDATACASYTRNDRGQIIRFEDILANLGTINTSGWDFSAHWLLPETGWGQLGFDWKATWVTRYELVNESGQAEPKGPGIEVNDSSIPEWSSTLATNWDYRNWNVNWTMRYIDRLRESCAGANGFAICTDSAADQHWLGATTYHDAQVSWRTDAWMKGVKVSVGVNNVFDKNPPICLSCTLNGYDPGTYDLPGRYTYARLSMDF